MSIKVKNAERAAYQAQFDAKKAADKMVEMQKEKDFMERELMQLSEKYGVQVSHLENKLDEMRRHKSALDSRVKELQATAHFPATIKSEPVDEPSKIPSAHAFSIAATIEQIKLADAPDRLAGLLSHGQKQWLEIGMLLMQEPRLLLLDEPVAGMTDAETERTAELFNSLAGKHTLVVVEHDMDFVGAIARTVTVLHEGSVLAEGAMDVVQNDERVIEVYLGR